MFPDGVAFGVGALVLFIVTEGLLPFDLRRILLLFICLIVGLVATKLILPIFLTEF